MNGELSGYLGHSQYGTKGEKVTQNTSSYIYTGGSNNKVTIYTTNNTQSTTHNATGVYDMVGGASEYVASYVNNGTGNLTTNGGEDEGDLCDNTGTKRGESTAYKTVYAKGTSSDSDQTNYEANAGKKGDAIYETSGAGNSSSASWSNACARFPRTSVPFFYRGGCSIDSNSGSFYFGYVSGVAGDIVSFRPVLVG